MEIVRPNQEPKQAPIQPPKKGMNGCLKAFLIFIGINIAIMLIANLFIDTPKIEEKKEPIIEFYGDKYYSEWTDQVNDDFFNISKTLNQNNITGCGEFYYIETKSNEYIVACTRDGENFKYYAVWGKKINDVIDVTYNSEMFKLIKPPKRK